ncbi:MAG TPA: hypothetical protein VNA28_07670 [Solirubrobacteraceae bacterium]|nr:hypothetical protein [Solirubrobacteraceae bacterium]
MSIRTATLVSLVLALIAIAPTGAAAAIADPQSDAAMRKAIRDYARYGVKDKPAKATKIKIDCVQATKVSSTRPCSGTFSLTLAGRTAHYKLTSNANTFRNSPGTIVAKLSAKATKKAAGLPSVVRGGSILQ